MVDVTPVLVGAITAASAIGAAFVTTYQQSKTQRQQAEAERARNQDSRVAAYRDQQKSNYAKLLDSERKLRTSLQGTVSKDDYLNWANEFFSIYHAVELTAPEPVRQAADDLYVLFERVDSDRQASSNADFSTALTNAFARHELEFEDARAKLLQAMRVDVLGESEPTSRPITRRPLSAPVR